MCAICGIVNKNKVVEPEIIKKMAQIMDYRGPDEEGFYFGKNVGLAHKRLKIIDLYTGKQPLSNEDKTVYLVCNGEIYNFLELRKNLEEKGHIFSSNSDNEVIIHLYEEKGVNCLKDLRGMFAFAIWDEKEKILFIARDRIGKKPLVYAETNGNFIFASEIKSILLNPEIKKEINPISIDLYFTYQAIPSPYTIFKQIKKLPPACYLVWKDGEIKIEKYWDIDFTKKLKLKDEKEYMEVLWEKLNEATKIRMISDVPLGAFLSGGIDSSTIVGIMSKFSSQPVKTFSIGFSEKDYSELKYAKLVANYFKTDHHEFIVKPDIIDILPKLIWHYNEPFGDSSMVPTYYVAQQTKKYVTVALNGDGGDENFAGYTRYWQTKLLEKIFHIYKKSPHVFSKNILNLLLNKYRKFPSNTFFRIYKWLEETEKNGFDYAYIRRLIAFSNNQKMEFYSLGMKEQLAGENSLILATKIWEQAGDIDLLEKMMYLDFHLYLPEVLMVKMDIATMANSLEGRSPFLDYQFIETIASFPSELKFKNFKSKYILKKKLIGFLPDEILKRKKMGFGIPVGIWFQKELKNYIEEILLSDKFFKRGYFNPEYINRILNEHISGKIIHTQRLWLLLNFELWNRIFIDGEKL